MNLQKQFHNFYFYKLFIVINFDKIADQLFITNLHDKSC